MGNKVILVGNVGNAPEAHALPSGGNVVNFSLATSSRFKDKAGNKQEKTQWHRLAVFNKLADVVQQYVSKGDKLYIEGAIEYQEYIDKKTGDKRYSTQILVRELEMLGSKGDGQGRGQAPQAAQAQPNHTPSQDFSSDIPF